MDDMPSPDALDMLRDLDPTRHIEIPGANSTDAERIRRRVLREAAGATEARSRRLLVAVVVVVFLLAAGTAAAVRIGFNPSASLESEGRGLETGSEQELRRIETGDATWTIVQYRTTEGDVCVDSVLTIGDVYHGAFGGCGFDALVSPIEGEAGGVWDGRDLRLLLTGRAAPTVATVSATDNLGNVLNDQPVDGIWAIGPAPNATSWIVEAFNQNGERIGRIEIVFQS
jgi:hypothetical protein